MIDSNDKKWFEKLRVNSWQVEILFKEFFVKIDKV